MTDVELHQLGATCCVIVARISSSICRRIGTKSHGFESFEKFSKSRYKCFKCVTIARCCCKGTKREIFLVRCTHLKSYPDYSSKYKRQILTHCSEWSLEPYRHIIKIYYGRQHQKKFGINTCCKNRNNVFGKPKRAS